MRVLSSARRKGFAAAAAGLLIAGAASAAAAATPPKPTASAEAEEDDGEEEAAPAGNTAQPATPAPQAGQAAAGLSHDEAVAATREGLRRSAIGSGIRRLRLFDYILMGGVGVLLLLSLALLALVMGLRSRLAALTGAAAGPAPTRTTLREEEQLYGNPTP